jgi:hypothetical protein
MELCTHQVDGLHFLIGDLHALGVKVAVDLAAYLEAGSRPGRADELHDHLVADQGLAAPVLGDEGEQAVAKR